MDLSSSPRPVCHFVRSKCVHVCKLNICVMLAGKLLLLSACPCSDAHVILPELLLHIGSVLLPSLCYKLVLVSSSAEDLHLRGLRGRAGHLSLSTTMAHKLQATALQSPCACAIVQRSVRYVSMAAVEAAARHRALSGCHLQNTRDYMG